MRRLLQRLKGRLSQKHRRNTESLVALFGVALQWTLDDMNEFIAEMDSRTSTGSIRVPTGENMHGPEFVLSWKEADGPWAFHLADPLPSIPTADRIQIFTLLNRSLNSLHLLNVPIR